MQSSFFPNSLCSDGPYVIAPPFSPTEILVVPPNTDSTYASTDDLPVTKITLCPSFSMYRSAASASRSTLPPFVSVIVPSISTAKIFGRIRSDMILGIITLRIYNKD
ncbi:Uncharacterised protein [uncultured archaeon]|nr:Uncharacterised protein [uncultured archaeon]